MVPGLHVPAFSAPGWATPQRQGHLEVRATLQSLACSSLSRPSLPLSPTLTRLIRQPSPLPSRLLLDIPSVSSSCP